MRSADEERRGLRRWTVAAIASILVATVAVATTYTPLFAASDIQIEGSHGISRRRAPRPGSRGRGLERVPSRHRARSNGAWNATRGSSRRGSSRRSRTRCTIEIVTRTPVGLVGPGGVGTPMELVGADGVVIGPGGAHRRPAGAARSRRRPRPRAGAWRLPRPRPARSTRRCVAPWTPWSCRRTGEWRSGSRPGSRLPSEMGRSSARRPRRWPPCWRGCRSGMSRVVSADLSVPGSPTAKLAQGSTAVPIP